MKRTVKDKETGLPFREDEAEPECGDFCACCGECLHCYISDPCDPPDEEHRWVVYEDRK